MSPSLTAWESTAETTRFAWAIRYADKPSEAISVENTFWADDASTDSGTYEVAVDVFNSCRTPAEWTLEVRFNGVLVLSESGNQELHVVVPVG